MTDFKTVYDSSSSAGSDPTSEYYIGTTKVSLSGAIFNVALSSDQLAAIISERLGGVPTPTESSLVITIANDTLCVYVDGRFYNKHIQGFVRSTSKLYYHANKKCLLARKTQFHTIGNVTLIP